MFEQPGWCRSSRQDKVVPPPGLLCSLLAVLAQVTHQGVALVLVIRVKAVVGARGWDGIIQLLHVRNLSCFLQNKVHPACCMHARRQVDFLRSFGVARGRGAHNVDARGEEAPVVSVFGWAGRREKEARAFEIIIYMITFKSRTGKPVLRTAGWESNFIYYGW